MAEKILSIKLNIDTSQGGKLFEVIKKVNSETEQLSSSTEKLSALEKQRSEAISKIASEYARLQNIANNASTAITERSRGWNLAEANLAKAIETSSQKYAEQSRIIKKSLDDQKVIRNSYNFLGDFTREQDARLAKLKQAQALELSLIDAKHAKEKAKYQSYEEAITRAAKEFSNRRIAQAAAEAERISSLRNGAYLNAAGSSARADSRAPAGPAPAGYSFATGAITAPEVANTTPIHSMTAAMTAYNVQARSMTGILTAYSQAQQHATSVTVAATSNTNTNTNAIHSNTTAHHANNAATETAVTLSRNLFLRAAELIGIYRVFNTVLGLTRQALLAIPKAGLEQQATQASILGIFGTSAGQENLKLVHDIAMNAGQSLLTLEQAYRRFAPSAILAGAKQQEVNQAFKDFAEVGTLLSLPEEKINALFLALDQMYAKGVVQSEEVKKQLGNVLPGAVETFAIAMGQTPAAFMAAMKNNEVIAREAIPKFAAYYRKIFGGPDDTVFTLVKDRLRSNLFRLETVYTDMNRAIFKDTQATMNNIVKESVKMVESVTANLKGIEQAVTILSDVILLRLAGAALAGVALNFTLLVSKIASFTRIISGMPLPVLAAATAIGSLYGKVNDLSVGYDKLTGFVVKFEDNAVSITNYIKAFATVAVDEFREAIEKLQNNSLITFGAGAGKVIRETFVSSIDLAVDSVYKLIAVLEAFGNRRFGLLIGTQESGVSFAEDYKKNLEALRSSTIESSVIVGEALTEQRKVLKLAAVEDQKDLIASFNGESAVLVQEAIKSGKLNAISFKAGWSEEMDSFTADIAAKVNEPLKASLKVDSIINTETPQAKLLDSLTAEQDKTNKNITEALKATVDVQATSLASVEEEMAASSEKVGKIYSTANKLLEERIKQYTIASKQIVDTLEQNKNDLEATYALKASRRESVDEALKLQQLSELDNRILNEKLSLTNRIKTIRAESFAITEKEVYANLNNLNKFEQALQWAESRNRKDAVSPTGALGLMQVQPSTAAGGDSSLGVSAIEGGIDKAILNLEHKTRVLKQKLTEAEIDVMKKYALDNEERLTEFGKQYFEALVKHFKGNLLQAAAAYNEGVNKAERGILTDETKQHRANILSKYNPQGEVEKETHLTNMAELNERISSALKEQHVLSNKLKTDTAEQVTAKRTEYNEQLRIQALETQGYNYEAGLQKLILEYSAKKLEYQNLGLASKIEELDAIYKSKAADLALADLESGLTTKQLQVKKQLLEIAGTAQEEFTLNTSKLDVLYNSIDAKGKAILTQAQYIQALGNINAKFNVAKDKELSTPIDKAIPAVKRYEEGIKKASKAMREFGSISNSVYNASLEGINRVSGIAQQMVEAQKNLSDTQIENEKKYKEAVIAVNEAKYVNPMVQMMDLYNLQKNHEESINQTRAEGIQNTLGGIAQMAAATSSMFAQNSNEAKAFNLIALAGLTAKGAAAILTQGEGDPYTAFARMAAMAAIVGNILGTASAGGFNFSGKTPDMSKEDQAKLNGAGTILGDSSLTSNSINKVYDLLKSIHAEEYVELRGINKGIQTLQGGITNTVTRLFQGGGLTSALPGGKDGLTGIGGLAQGITKINIDPLGNLISKKILGGLFGVTKYANIGTGISTGATQAGTILDGGNVNAKQFDVIQKSTKSWFKQSFSYKVQFSELDKNVNNSLNGIFSSIGSIMLGLSKELGGDLENKLRAYIIPALSIDLKGLTGEEASKKLSGILSATLDNLSTEVFGSLLGQYQQLGEGMLETTIRIVSEVALVKEAISATSHTLVQDVIGISDALVQAAGGIEEFQKQFETFYDKFFTEGEKFDRLTKRLGSQLGEIFPTSTINILAASREGYRQVIEAIDLTTEAGQTQYSTLLALADAADQWYTTVYDVQTKALDTAKANLEKAYKAEADILNSNISKLNDFIKTLKDFRDSLVLGESSIFTPGQKYAEAARQYEATKATILNGPGTTETSRKIFEDAMAEITGKAQGFLDTSRIYNASSQAYTNDFNRVLADINAGVANAEAMKTDVEKQLDLLNASVSSLITINESILSVKDAIDALNSSVVASFGNASIRTFMTEATSSLGRQLTIAEAQWVIDQFNLGRTKEDISAEAAPYIKAHGSHADGLDYVPFDGYIAELHRGERVVTAANASRDSAISQEILAELKYLREAVANFHADSNEGTGAIIQSNYDANDRAATKVERSLTEAERRKTWNDANKVSLS